MGDVRMSLLSPEEQRGLLGDGSLNYDIDDRAEQVFNRGEVDAPRPTGAPSVFGLLTAGGNQLQNMYNEDNKQWVHNYQSKYIYPALVIVPLIILFIMSMVISISIVSKLIMGILCLLVAVFFYVYIVYSRRSTVVA